MRAHGNLRRVLPLGRGVGQLRPQPQSRNAETSTTSFSRPAVRRVGSRILKFLHLSNRYPPYAHGTAERQCRLIVNELGNRGHFNRVLTCDHVVAAVPDREAVALRRLVLESHEKDSATTFFKLLLDEQRNLRVLREELDQIHPDVVLVWGMAGLSNCLLWEIERRGVRLAFAILDHWPRHRVREDPWFQWWSAPLPFGPRLIRRFLYSTRLYGVLQRRLPVRRPTDLRLGNAFFSSRALRETIRNAGYHVEGSEVIPCCIGRDEFPGQSQRRDDLRRLLWIGHLDTDRDPMTAIQAIQELRHNGEMRFSLDIFGRGDVSFESRLHDYLRDSQLAGAVTIRHTSVEELVALFPTYDMFVFTPRYPEPFPLVLLRAMAARLPVVSTVEGSCADIVRNGENALTFRTGDPVDCARRIYQIASDREAVDQMTERAYRDVLDNYSALTVAGRVDRFLTEVARFRSR